MAIFNSYVSLPEGKRRFKERGPQSGTSPHEKSLRSCEILLNHPIQIQSDRC